MHRIPHGLSGPSDNRTAILLQHGLLSSSLDFVVTGPEKGLGFILADLGYDVWLGNARGNTHSRNHTTLSPDNVDFWNFSWHEIGMYDISAMIDKVISTTGQPKIHYAGHSQGTTGFFVLMSMRPEYNAKIRSAHMLSPVGYMSNLISPFFRVFAPVSGVADLVTTLIGAREFLPSTQMMQDGGALLCQDKSPFQEVCANVLFLIAGYDSVQLNRTALPKILHNYPAGSSVRQVVHYAQEINSAKFRQYDYGYVLNFVKYFSFTPPNYPVNKITCPVMFYHSDNDWLAAVKDVKQLADQIPNLIQNYKVPFPKFNHLDFLWAIDVKTLLYDKVIEVLGLY